MPTMTDAEKALLHSHMMASSHYLEFGAGESTIDATDISTIHTIDSVESSPDFIEAHLKEHPAIMAALSSGKLKFHLVDIGETKEWGYPANEERKHLFPNYPLSIFAQRRDYDFDLIFVDGRFRVACILCSLLSTPPDCVIVVHDFWNRQPYHRVLTYLDVVARADSLAVFRRKELLDSERILTDLQVFQYVSF